MRWLPACARSMCARRLPSPCSLALARRPDDIDQEILDRVADQLGSDCQDVPVVSQSYLEPFDMPSEVAVMPWSRAVPFFHRLLWYAGACVRRDSPVATSILSPTRLASLVRSSRLDSRSRALPTPLDEQVVSSRTPAEGMRVWRDVTNAAANSASARPVLSRLSSALVIAAIAHARRNPTSPRVGMLRALTFATFREGIHGRLADMPKQLSGRTASAPSTASAPRWSPNSTPPYPSRVPEPAPVLPYRASV